VRAFHVRVGLLVLVLAAVAGWAWDRLGARRARTTWDRPVAVAVLVLGEAPPESVEALSGALDALGASFAADMARLRGRGPAPFTFEVVGPLAPERLPPTEPPEPALLSRAAHAFDLWRATRSAHAAAPGFEPDAHDVRIYLVAQPAGPGGRLFVEGLGDLGGEVGIVRASLDWRDPLLAAAAVSHEVMHCLGASDKYDAMGHAIEPAGLADPDLLPVHPQRRAEIMVGEIPLAPGRGRLPEHAGEVGIGPVTAAEIGWGAAGR
jgi:hypothetical protein